MAFLPKVPWHRKNAILARSLPDGQVLLAAAGPLPVRLPDGIIVNRRRVFLDSFFLIPSSLPQQISQ
jgi:hypothetical protein